MLIALKDGPPVAKAEPTSLLAFVAGEFAPRVAALWPAPHGPFVTASPARRHLACLALAFGRSQAAREALLLRLPRAMALALGGPAPHGLARALTRIGEVAWSAADYRKLLQLLRNRHAAKAVWHADALDPDLVCFGHGLPSAGARFREFVAGLALRR